MLIDLTTPNKLVVRREVTDTIRFKNESHFLHHLKKALQARGNDCIKKLAWKDGHLVDDYMYYIRERKFGWYVYDGDHQIRSCAAVFMKDGEVTLWIDRSEKGYPK